MRNTETNYQLCVDVSQSAHNGKDSYFVEKSFPILWESAKIYEKRKMLRTICKNFSERESYELVVDRHFENSDVWRPIVASRVIRALRVITGK